MRQPQMMRSGIGLLGILCLLLIGCASISLEEYFSQPPKISIGKPVYIAVTDSRPSVESQPPQPNARYAYTYLNSNLFAANLTNDLMRAVVKKGLAKEVDPILPMANAPQGSVVIRVDMLSWYGRIPLRNLKTMEVSEKMGLIPQGTDVNGKCRFAVTLSENQKHYNLGICEGTSYFLSQTQPTLENEGNHASAIAADKAILCFLQKLEYHYVAETR